MATTRKYDNGPNGWTDYNDKGQAVAAGTYNAPGTARNPFNADAKAQGITDYYKSGSNSGDGALWSLSLIHISEPTRLGMISYAVFCLKKKKKEKKQTNKA